MALTTSDELQKQLTVIFGFNGQLQIESWAYHWDREIIRSAYGAFN